MQKGKKRVHRLVVLPDYQGVGIGTRFIKAVASLIWQRGYELNLTTTTPSLVGALRRDPQWVLARFGRASKTDGYVKRYGDGSKTGHLANSTSMNRITYSFWYKE
jgi:GNAT superfamily N-acetyltransferase